MSTDPHDQHPVHGEDGPGPEEPVIRDNRRIDPETGQARQDADAGRRARLPDARCGRLTVRRRRVVLLVRHRRTLRGRVTALR